MNLSEQQSMEFLNSELIDENFFNSIIEKKLNVTRNIFKINHVMLSPATNKNDNYMSNIYQARIKILLLNSNNSMTLSFIFKVLLPIFEDYKKFDVFQRECFMYEDMIPSLEKIWLDRADEIVEFAPKCLKTEEGSYEVIVLDNLKANGYEMMDRKVGLTVDQTKLALTKLAKFHASSAVRYQKDGTVQNFLDRKLSITPENKSNINQFAKRWIADYYGFLECLKNYGDCKYYTDKIAEWNQQKLSRHSLVVVNPMKCGMVVLTHGDFWLNNLMFKFNESNEPKDVQILDYQSSSWGTPSLDLHYFLISSVHDDIKIVLYDEFIEHYHDEFVKSLKILNYRQYVPTLDDLYEDMMEKSEMVAVSLLFILFITKYESTEEISMEYVIGDCEKNREFYNIIYGNETYKKALKLWLPFLDERGYLDALMC